MDTAFDARDAVDPQHGAGFASPAGLQTVALISCAGSARAGENHGSSTSAVGVRAFVTLGLVFAQIRHSCACLQSDRPRAAQAKVTFVEPADTTMPADCAAMAKPAASERAMFVSPHCTVTVSRSTCSPMRRLPRLAPAACVDRLTVVSSIVPSPSLDRVFLHAAKHRAACLASLQPLP